ncbi:MAG TPA: AraC family transcriptional regulator ligand-binding domain-containing protein [Polyangiaceae bacterium]|jgi:AraC-like DNA-binding protein|nr:AraC family transcriptional regulator ligand-binding domain-containing protein [Polyangiaceae bacterium]
MTPLYSSHGFSVPASYAEQLVRLVRRWKVRPQDLLGGLGLTEEGVEDPMRRLSLPTYAALIERARTLTGEPGLGFYLGLQKRISGYGYLGFAAMSASSLGEALELVTRLSPMLTTSITLRLRVEDRVAALVVEEHVDMGSARDVALIGLIFGLKTISQMVTGQDVRSSYVDLPIPEPAYFPRFRHLMPSAHFGRPVGQVVFDSELLGLPLVQADPAALRLARDQCERALDALGYENDLVVRVRQALWQEGGEGLRSFEGVAEILAMSARTLRRMLTARGLSFSGLLEVERRDKATFLLQASRASLDDVAARLGYSSLSNFVRAFHRWTGMTPAVYRRTCSRPVVLPQAFR